MNSIPELLRRNTQWAERIRAEDPTFFERLSRQQAPEYLWIGCSDSRVPANQIIDVAPGEVFVHRNIANVVVQSDLNCLSVIQFAVDVLKVKHILVVGHYGCGGVHAALTDQRVGLSDNWIRHVTNVAETHASFLSQLCSEELRHDRLCELNVLEQVINVCHSTVVRDCWERGQSLAVHGWVYTLRDGRVHDLGIDMDNLDTMPARHSAALARIYADREDR
ncbi:carbonate dehydratase [Lysobacter sp. H23M47]|uniref:carbonate dehydratase n=1 Tax=Lysobacter sp. H23M47 TaxID=2781024 RepID=UPI00187EE953|nr:carbonate dehydratase [Lysobacter sp. H23M47]QOW23583.1 carbonate dehydratase [Lysobacter sp. H23M47]